MTTIHKTDFPYEEIRQGGTSEGNYFDTYEEALLEANGNAFHVWSLTEDESEDGTEIIFTYGPGRHFVNVIGYLCTQETHDGDTYYEETYKREE